MKKLISLCLCLTMLISSAVQLNSYAVSDNSVTAVEQTVKNSDIDYTESTETIDNPCVGYTSTLWYTCKPLETPVYSRAGRLVLMFIDIGGFSSGINGTQDYDLDETFFTNLRKTLENCKNDGCTIALRFRYDANGTDNPEPATFEKVLDHIQQIKDSNILEDYKDVITFVESGFVGKWGEQHGGKYTSLDYKVQLLEAMLDCVPEEIPVTVRTPDIFAKWVGISTSEMDKYVSADGSPQQRVGLYNDGYMGSDSDLGTFSNRAVQTTWLGNQTLHTYYGGEFSGNLDWAKKYDTYLPENAIPEMYKTHLSYINSNIYQLYKDYTFSEQYDVENVDNSAYYGQTVFKFVRDHLGYRFVLRNSELSETVPHGDTLKLNFTVENTGFASLLKAPETELILEKDGNYIRTSLDIDPMQWYSCTTNTESISAKIPAGLEAGKWNAYLKISVGNNDISQVYMRSVKFANNGLWNTSIGANYLGSFEVTGSADTEKLTDNSFYQENSENRSDGEMFTYNDIIIPDGDLSSNSEWTDKTLYTSNGDNAVYISNDEKNLYVMAKIVQNAQSPVYNIKIECDSETYWLYYMPNGYVYFNKGDYTGCICKHVGNYVEYVIPFDVIGLETGKSLSSVRVFVQDSSVTGWTNVGDLKGGEYTINENFDVYTACRDINLKENESFSLNVETSLKNATYQWYLNDKKIEGATEKTFTIRNASAESKGTYSVAVISESGFEKKVPVCNLNEVYGNETPDIVGDVNRDGTVDKSDMKLLKEYVLGMETADSYADVNKDGVIDTVDIIKLKNILSQ